MGDADGGEGVVAQQKLGIRAAFDLAQGILLVRAAGGPSGGGAYMARMRALSVCVHLQAVTFSAPSSEQGVGGPRSERGWRGSKVVRSAALLHATERRGCPISSLTPGQCTALTCCRVTREEASPCKLASRA